MESKWFRRDGTPGIALLLLSVVLVTVSYPPIGNVQPLFGMGNLFLPLLVSVVAILLTIGGGYLTARSVISANHSGTVRLLASALIQVGSVLGISVYLVVVGGFSPQAPFIIGGIVLATIAFFLSYFRS